MAFGSRSNRTGSRFNTSLFLASVPTSNKGTTMGNHTENALSRSVSTPAESVPTYSFPEIERRGSRSCTASKTCRRESS